MAAERRRSLHGFAWVALAGAFLLVLAGGQGHRILGVLLGAWTAFLVAAVLRSQTPALVRRLTIGAAGLVIVQAVLGGLSVLEWPADLVMVHALVGQLFFANLAALVAVTSPAWEQGEFPKVSRRQRVQGTILLAAMLVQVLLGLLIRHLGAAARPLAGTPLLYAHVIGAGIVLSSLLDFQRTPAAWDLPGGRLLLPLVWLQIFLGVAAYVTTDDLASERQATFLESWVPTLHAGTGAALLGIVVVENMHLWRARLAAGATSPRAALGRLL